MEFISVTVPREKVAQHCRLVLLANNLIPHPRRPRGSFVKRLGLRMTRAGRRFSVIDATGELAVNTKRGMSLAEIEQWIDISRPRVWVGVDPWKACATTGPRQGQRVG